MKKILYLHGFGSSGASGTVEVLRHAFWDKEKDPSKRVQVIAPDIPVDPQEALPFLKALVAKEQPDFIVGTSMGGMYAQQLRGFPRICVNPSFGTSKLYSLLHVGKYKWLNKRKDGALEFHIYKETIEHYAEMEAHQFDGITAVSSDFLLDFPILDCFYNILDRAATIGTRFCFVAEFLATLNT